MPIQTLQLPSVNQDRVTLGGDGFDPVGAMVQGQKIKSQRIQDTYQELVNSGYKDEEAARIALQKAQTDEATALTQGSLQEKGRWQVHNFKQALGRTQEEEKRAQGKGQRLWLLHL